MMSELSKHSMRVLPFFIVAALTSGFSFLGSHPAHVFVFSIFMLSVAAVLLAVSYAERPYSWRQTKTAVSRHSNRMTMIIISASVALTISVLVTHWPLRLSYSLSKASLNRIAKQVTSGTKALSPQSASVFSVTRADVDNGLVCLWIDEDMGEPIGFVQGSLNKIKARFPDYNIIVLDGNWCLVNSL